MLACGAVGAHAAAPVPITGDYGVRAVCPPAGTPRLRCHALELTPPSGGAGASTSDQRPRAATAGGAQTAECAIPRASEGCVGLRPQDLHLAYELPQAPVSQQTIAIVAAGGDPRIDGDLANYDREFKLEACSGETACPTVVNGEGNRRPLPAVEGEAPLETSLDVEMAHAICTACKLLLVEASAESLPAFEEATDTAARLGADEISISFGEAEPAQVPDDGAAFDHRGIVITAAAGDSGYLNWASAQAERGRPEYPASSPDVIAVGGTSLELGPAGEWHDEHVWDQLEPLDEAGGSGCSALFPAPSWQLELPKWAALGCGGRRATADISAVADPRLGVAVYDSNKDSEGHKVGWRPVGGTSAGTPLIAAAFALAGGAHGVPYPAQTLYRNAAASNDGLLHDITSGTNGACERFLGRGCTAEEQAGDCGSGPICVAGPGYDGPTGLGSLHGIGALEPRLAFRTPAPSPARRGDSFAAEAEVELTGQPAAVASATPGVCTAVAGHVSLLAAGTCTLTASEPGYLEAQQSFAVERTQQEVSFSSEAPVETVVGGAAYLPAVSASSGLQVSLVSLTPTVCAVQGDAVMTLAAGVCTIAAEQDGDADYEPAPAATQSYPVAAAGQSITFLSPAPTGAVAGGPSYLVRAAASSGLPVSLTSLTPGTCTLQGTVLTLLGPGTCTVAATQPGDAAYAAAPEALLSFAVAAGGTLSFHTAPTPFTGAATLRLLAAPSVSRHNGAITFSLAAAPAGTVRWLVTFSAQARCASRGSSCAREIVRFASGRTSTAGGTITLKVRPDAAALRMLRSRHALRVHALLTLATASGSVARAQSTSVVRLAPAR